MYFANSGVQTGQHPFRGPIELLADGDIIELVLMEQWNRSQIPLACRLFSLVLE